MTIQEKILKKLPVLLQDAAISIYNTYQYKLRYGGDYEKFRKYYRAVEDMSEQELLEEVDARKKQFFSYVKKNSPWYSNYNFTYFPYLPILEKSDIINELDKIKTINEKEGLISLTGGTTGSSMRVIYTVSNVQERFAILDHFRAQHGYNLGKRTAWFSGKNLISEKDLNKGVCAHYDFINKIKFYSTFHINQQNFPIYWKSLKEFKPEFIVGFPSSVYEICKIADSKGLVLPNKVKVFFPTAETVLAEHRQLINKVMGCQVVNQYASSEGAPFILECKEGSLHIHPLTGIFEVVDKNLNPTLEGEILITSFTTYGTPLIRYRIGDRIKLAPSDRKCTCGSKFQIVERIDGRTTDYILSPTHGKVNLGNISNSTKNINGLLKFQVIQDELDKVDVLIVSNKKFNNIQQSKFKDALQERFGPNLSINLKLVNNIPCEKSGKFKLVKNSLGV